MRVFDRYSQQETPVVEVTGVADFGRYMKVDDDLGEFTSDDGMSFKLQSGILETPFLRDFFLKTNEDVSAQLMPPPIIRSVSERLNLLPFEKLLEERLFHIEAAVRDPHTLLRREFEKVNVAAARKVPPKSYEYIAGHTEDWEFKSVFAFKPRSVIHEVLDVEFELYENQALVSFVERVLNYLDNRLDETTKLGVFFEELKSLVADKEMDKMWYLKRDRNLSLIGFTYQESVDKGTRILRSTQSVLRSLQNRLGRLFDNTLFKAVGRVRIQSPVLRATNVLVNHKHYRYLRQLWAELNIAQPEPSDEEKKNQNQSVYDGLIDFGLSLFHYSLEEHLGFSVTHDERQIIAHHPKGESVFPKLRVTLSKHKEIRLEFGEQNLVFVVIGNNPTGDVQNSFNETAGRKLLYLNLDGAADLEMDCKSSIPISPYDADSSERISSVIKGMMLRRYRRILSKKTDIPHGLKNYLPLIKPEYIELDFSGYKTFHVTGLIKDVLPNLDEWLDEVRSNQSFRKAGRDKQRQILGEVEVFHMRLSDHLNFFQQNALFCFNDQCGEPLDYRVDEIRDFNYIKCKKCKAAVEKKGNQLSFRIEEEKYANLKDQDWGCDRLDVSALID